MPMIKFSPETVGKPCPHGHIHGIHRTKDGREMGMCQLGDDHLRRLIGSLRTSLNDAYKMPYVLQAAKGDYDPHISEMEDSLKRAITERQRRKVEKALGR